MNVVSVLVHAAAVGVLVAAIMQAAALKKRVEALPKPAESEHRERPAQGPPPSPYEMSELAARLEALGARIDAKVAREEKELAAARERFGTLRIATGDSLAVLDEESAKVKEAIGDQADDKEKVAALTKKIRDDQQKALIRKFVGNEFRKENEKLKALLELTPEQAVKFDEVSAELMDKVSEMGSNFMNGDMNPAGFIELQKTTNEKMGSFLTEDQMGKYKKYQDERWGGGRRQAQGDGQ